MNDKYLFVLDVGTRKVTGLILEPNEGGFCVVAAETREHVTRAMVDGQIHDIPKVAEVVSVVHQALEEQADTKITGAAVAAAGRSLYTQVGRAQIPVNTSTRLGKQDILWLEYAAVQNAHSQLLSGSVHKVSFTEQYNCVGYSLIRYELDGSAIGSLEGQRGNTMACEVIATFLPRVVVDSLQSVLDKVGLRLDCLTLEPIAALRMAVPNGMRQLNLALVDVGAGTSDIAITREGTVLAYDMVPAAGDEITEALAEKALLDFMAADKLKRKLSKGGKVKYTNILGEAVEEPAEKLVSEISGAVRDLADKIAQVILKKNGAPPQAVLCVGGGSLTPGLTGMLAECLGLAPGRVAIKGKEMLSMLPQKKRRYQGPDLVTPLGIGCCALSGDVLKFIRVTVNGNSVDVVDLGAGKVSDVLLTAGISARDLVGPPGKGMTLEVNGQMVVIPGELGTMAEIQVNGKAVSLENEIKAGDEISLIPAEAGRDATATVANLLSRITPFTVAINGRRHKLEPQVYRDDENINMDTELYDRDKIKTVTSMPLHKVFQQLGMEKNMAGSSITVRVNGREKHLPYGTRVVRINGREAVPDSVVSAGDVLEVGDDGVFPTVSSLTAEKPQEIRLTVNGEPLSVARKNVLFKVNNKEVPAETLIAHGDKIEIRVVEHNLTMADILHFMQFQVTPPQGKHILVMRVNGEDAQFTTHVRQGDSLEVKWAAQRGNSYGRRL